MNNKVLIGIGIVIILIIIVGLTTNDAPETPQQDTISGTQEDVTVVDSTMPVPDSGAIPEMVVSESVDSEVLPTPNSESAQKEFLVDSFSFGYSMSEIRVTEGDTVTINLTNSNGFHDWVVDEFNAATEKIQAGDTTSVTFVADTAGSYEFYCSVGNHRAQGMVGTLVVEPRQ